MAGGGGTRLWPLSRENHPKQFLFLQPGGLSLLQAAVRRAESLTGSLQRVLVVTQQRYADLTRAQLPDLPSPNLVLEPVGRNTAPCLALAARIIQQRAPQAVMAVLPADHLFRQEQPWLQAMQRAVAFAAQQPYLVTLGIRPSAASSRYGYLQLGGSLDDQAAVHQVEAFIEKPALEKARSLIESGSALWNTGAFAWQVQVFWQAVERALPEVAHGLRDLGDAALAASYPQLPNISVDYGVMEKALNVAVVVADFERLDLGALESLAEIWPQDDHANTCQPLAAGSLVAVESTGNLVAAAQGLVALVGVHGLAVVRAGEVLLVCPRARLDEIRQVAAELRRRGLAEYL